MEQRNLAEEKVEKTELIKYIGMLEERIQTLKKFEIKDKKKKGGAYYKIKAIITKINIIEGFITLSNKEKIKLDDIYSIEI